ncbi:hypothetical protein XBI1_400044 [Xenorhabdus bovienii str. Intermedium]|uniref:Uncharacterized protein n=1 Tax=Xenorhabdus bovienii str. Intermedium TaxID=1379677 RepID=A0A077QMC2_XENBV|nr:hypothetical protein XBI1_400044 [Xenorhabdus bovienii str. Intermedium]
MNLINLCNLKLKSELDVFDFILHLIIWLLIIMITLSLGALYKKILNPMI